MSPTLYPALGRALHSRGKAEEARAAFRAAVNQFQHTLGPGNAHTLAALQLANGDPHTH